MFYPFYFVGGSTLKDVSNFDVAQLVVCTSLADKLVILHLMSRFTKSSSKMFNTLVVVIILEHRLRKKKLPKG